MSFFDDLYKKYKESGKKVYATTPKTHGETYWDNAKKDIADSQEEMIKKRLTSAEDYRNTGSENRDAARKSFAEKQQENRQYTLENKFRNEQRKEDRERNSIAGRNEAAIAGFVKPTKTGSGTPVYSTAAEKKTKYEATPAEIGTNLSRLTPEVEKLSRRIDGYSTTLNDLDKRLTAQKKLLDQTYQTWQKKGSDAVYQGYRNLYARYEQDSAMYNTYMEEYNKSLSEFESVYGNYDTWSKQAQWQQTKDNAAMGITKDGAGNTVVDFGKYNAENGINPNKLTTGANEAILGNDRYSAGEIAGSEKKATAGDYAAYTATQLAAGMQGQIEGAGAGLVTAAGDLMTGINESEKGSVLNLLDNGVTGVAGLFGKGSTSNDYQKLTMFLAENPEYEKMLMGPGSTDGAAAYVAKLAGVNVQNAKAYRVSNQSAWQEREWDKEYSAVSTGYKNTIGKMMYQVGQQLPGMILTMGAGNMLGNISTLAKDGVITAAEAKARTAAVEKLSKAVSVGLMSVGASGRTLTERANDNGYSALNYAYAAADGAIEAATEYMLGTAGDTASTMLKVKNLRTFFSNAVEEGVEELVGYPMGEAAGWLFNDAKSAKEWVEKVTTSDAFQSYDVKEWLAGGLSGFALGGILGVSGLVMNAGIDFDDSGFNRKITGYQGKSGVDYFTNVEADKVTERFRELKKIYGENGIQEDVEIMGEIEQQFMIRTGFNAVVNYMKENGIESIAKADTAEIQKTQKDKLAEAAKEIETEDETELPIEMPGKKAAEETVKQTESVKEQTEIKTAAETQQTEKTAAETQQTEKTAAETQQTEKTAAETQQVRETAREETQKGNAEAVRIRNSVKAADAESVSTQELKVRNAGDGVNRILPDSVTNRYATTKNAKEILKNAGWDATFVAGSIVTKDGNVRYAMTTDSVPEVVIQADSKIQTAEEIAREFLQERGIETKGVLENGTEEEQTGRDEIRMGGRDVYDGRGESGVREAERGKLGAGQERNGGSLERVSKKLSERDLGIINGSKDKNLTVLKRENSQETEDMFRYAEENGIELTAVDGDFTVERNGIRMKANGASLGNRKILVSVKAGARKTGMNILKHEHYHEQMRDAEFRTEEFRKLKEEKSADEIRDIFERYFILYKGIYGNDVGKYIEEFMADEYAAYEPEFKEGTEAQKKRAREIARAASGKPVSIAGEVLFSRAEDEKLMQNAVKKNKNGVQYVSDEAMQEAAEKRQEVKEILDRNEKEMNLPEDKKGKTFYGDSAYGGSEENSPVCIRSMAADSLMDLIAEEIGRPLTVKETTVISQALFEFTDMPECLYCYVAMDRKAYREYLLRYIMERDEVIKNIENGMSEAEAYNILTEGKKERDTGAMQKRFASWVRMARNGSQMIAKADLASERNMQEAMKENQLRGQVEDARRYAQSASWAKKRNGYAAYNGHILRWKKAFIETLNKQYGLRFYSFSDYTVAYVLENMQMVTDASVMGLKALGYTKELGFVEVFAPTGMNINISVFAYKDGNGFVQDGMQGADWEKAKKLRRKYKNVGITMVATSDEEVEWALSQDWIDTVIPFHMVKTGAKVAEYFNFKNYTRESADKAMEGKLLPGQHIYPWEHQNDKETFLRLCRERNVVPRFSRWVENPNYMKLVNETRQSDAETQTVQPIFNTESIQDQVDELIKRGGYNAPYGKTKEAEQEYAEEIAGKLKDMVPDGEEALWSADEEADAEYMKLAEDPEGNKVKLQKMVYEEAKKKGYDSQLLYHGTASFGFTHLSTSYSDDKISFFVTESEDTAKTYSYDAETRLVRKANTDELLKKADEAERKFHDEIYSMIDYLKRLAGVYNFVDYIKVSDKIVDLLESHRSHDSFNDILTDYTMDLYYDAAEESGMSDEEKDSGMDVFFDEYVYPIVNAGDAKRIAFDEWNKGTSGTGNYSFYGKLGNILEIEGNGRNWNNIPLGKITKEFNDWWVSNGHEASINGFYPTANTRSISEFAKYKGYDGVKFKDIVDDGGRSSKRVKATNVYSLFNPSEQLKSSDPVTYDDSGNVIPLSERFNPENEDIRFSSEDTMPEYWSGIIDGLKNAEAKAYTEKGFIQYMKNYGVSEEELRESRVMDAWDMDSMAEDGFVDADKLLRYARVMQDVFRKDAKRMRTEAVTKAQKQRAVQNETRKLQRELLGAFEIPGNVRDEARDQITNFADWLADNPNHKAEELTEKMNQLIADLMSETRVTIEEGTEDFKRAANMMKGAHVYVSDIVKGDFGEDWIEARRKLFGAGIWTVQDKGLPLDVWWMELAGNEPGIFDEKETDGRSMIERIIQVAEEARGQSVTPEEYARKTGADYDAMYQDYMNAAVNAIAGYYNAVMPIAKAEREKLPVGMTIDQYTEYLDRKAKEDAAKRIAIIQKTDFEGTPAMKNIGIRITGSVTEYGVTEQIKILSRDRAKAQYQARKTERIAGATELEKARALEIAKGNADFADTVYGKNLRRDVVGKLVDVYTTVEGYQMDMIEEHKREVKARLREQMETLIGKTLPMRKMSMPVLNHETPERIMRTIYGDVQGEKLYRDIFSNVKKNGAEMYRWQNEQKKRVEKFADQNGKQKALDGKESAVVQMVMESKAAQEYLAQANEKKRNDITEAAKEFYTGTHGKRVKVKDYGKTVKQLMDYVMEKHGLRYQEAEYAFQMSQLSEAQYMIAQYKMDTVHIENAVKGYREAFDSYYDAINDFLVMHGYEQIGFIKGYTPHMQTEEAKNVLSSVLDVINISDKVSSLPTDIAGITQEFRPNKKWDPFFLQREGFLTSYDIRGAMDAYIDYLGQVFYRTDDIMRMRAMSGYLREMYAPDNLRMILDWSGAASQLPADVMRDWLVQEKVIANDSRVSDEDIKRLYEEHKDKVLEQAAKGMEYGNFVMWLDNYANILAGKQSMADRGIEYKAGRKALNFGQRLVSAFGRANVVGNVSSMINQTAQLSTIIGENSQIDIIHAIADMVTGKVRAGGWVEESDFLVGKKGVDRLSTDTYDDVIHYMGFGLEAVDRVVSILTVRTKYDEMIRKGMSHEEAMEAADEYGRQVMGSRMRGEKPLGFESKGPIDKAVHMFQVEALNSWEHIALDLPAEIRKIEREQGKRKAAAALAHVIIKTLVAAFVLNRAAEEIYGGNPAPFDIAGLSCLFVASGQGLTVNEWLKEAVDNWMEKMGKDRFFRTEKREGTDFDTESAMKETGQQIAYDIPMLRNLAALIGWGDGSLPIVDAGAIYEKAKEAWTEAWNGEWEQTADAGVEILSNLIPGGRQVKKTYQGAQAMAEGGKYNKAGNLEYPLEDTAWNWARALIFGRNALTQAQQHWASGETALGKNQTAAYQRMVEAGENEEDAYRLLIRMRRMEADETESAEVKQSFAVLESNLSGKAKRDCWYEMFAGDKDKDLMDELEEMGADPDEVVRVMANWKALNADGVENSEQKQFDLIRSCDLDGEQKYAIYYAKHVKSEKEEAMLDELDKSGENMGLVAEAMMNITDAGRETGWEASNNKRKAILESGLSDSAKENLYLNKISDERADDIETFKEAGMTVDDMMIAQNQYAVIENKEGLEESQQALELSKWLDQETDYTREQKETVKEVLIYWQMTPASTEKYNGYVTGGMDSDDAYKLINDLAELEPEEGKKQVSDVQRWRVISEQPISESDKEIAMEYAMSESQFVRYSMAREYEVSTYDYVTVFENADGNGNGSITQDEAKAAINLVSGLSTEQKAALWQMMNKSWKAGKNPYSTAVGQKVYDRLNAD